MGQSQTTLHREEEDLGGRGPMQQDPIKASLPPAPPSCASSGLGVEGSTVPSSLDSSLEKTILSFFLETCRWVSGCHRVVRRGSGVTKSLCDAAEARRRCLETRKGRGMSPKRKDKRNLYLRGGPRLVCPARGCLTYQQAVSWLMGLSGYPLGQSQVPLLHPNLWCDRPEASARIHLLQPGGKKR